MKEENLEQWQHQIMKLQLFPSQPPDFLRVDVPGITVVKDNDVSLQRIRCEALESYDLRVRRPIFLRRESADTVLITSSDEED